MKTSLSMKTLAAIALLLILGSVGWVSQAAADDDSKKVTSTFDVNGMTCGGCEVGVKMKVKKLEGVTSVDASYKDGTAEVAYDPQKVTPAEIIAAIEDLGYTAKLAEDEAGG